MNLEVSQLKKIDSYLKSKGVEYWDVRYEFSDHMACFIESKLEEGSSFEVAFKEIEKDFTRGYLKGQQEQVRKKLNKYIRKTYLTEIKNSVVKPIYILGLIAFGVMLKFVMESYKVKYSLWIGFSFMIFLLIMILFKSLKDFKMHKKSLLLNLSGTYVIFFTLVFQVIGYVKEQMLTNKLLQVVLSFSIVLICFLMLTWFNCYSKLIERQKKYYNLING